VEKLEEEHRAALDNERNRTQEALAQAIKDKQQAQDRQHAAFAHVHNLQSMMEHTTAISKVFEGDLMELQRLDIEVCLSNASSPRATLLRSPTVELTWVVLVLTTCRKLMSGIARIEGTRPRTLRSKMSEAIARHTPQTDIGTLASWASTT
jgi:hypothetical protein